MFIGEFEHNIDKKGRIIIPASFRKELGDFVYVTKGTDGCLNIYDNEQWSEILTKLNNLPTTKRDSRIYIRKVSANSKKCEFDEQGRILLPSKLITYANLAKKCVIIGAINHLEIWDKDKWDAEDATTDEIFEDIAESLTEYLL